MKVIKKYTTGILLLIALFGLSSCLKNGPEYIDFAGVSASIDIPLAAPSVVIGYQGNGVVQYVYNPSSTTWTYTIGGLQEPVPAELSSGSPFVPVYVNVASPSPLSTSVTATLALDTAYFNSFNAANGGIFTLMPSNCYTITTMSLTVPSGQRLDSTNVTFNFANMDSVQNYILPITIASSSLPIEQWNHLLLNVSSN
jgi:hypothetical protein